MNYELWKKKNYGIFQHCSDLPPYLAKTMENLKNINFCMASKSGLVLKWTVYYSIMEFDITRVYLHH